MQRHLRDRRGRLRSGASVSPVMVVAKGQRQVRHGPPAAPARIGKQVGITITSQVRLTCTDTVNVM
jgi:hypothetical protein